MSGIVISKDRTGDGFYTGILISLLRLANNSALCLMSLNSSQFRVPVSLLPEGRFPRTGFMEYFTPEYLVVLLPMQLSNLDSYDWGNGRGSKER